MNPFDLCSINDFKQIIDKPELTTGKDDVIARIITRASRQIESHTKRLLRSRTITEYHDGRNHGYLFLGQFPVISITSIYDSADRAYDSADLIASTDYTVKNETGELRLDSGSFGNYKSNVRAIYVGGFEQFEVITDLNDSVDFAENAGSGLSATLDAGVYTGSELATELKTQLDASGTSTYTVTYNRSTGKFKIVASAGNTVLFSWESGDNSYKQCGALFGFDIEDQSSASSTVNGDYAVFGIPEDLVSACVNLTLYMYNDSSLGKARAGLLKNTVGGTSSTGTSTEYIRGKIPSDVAGILEPYIRRVK